MQNRLSSIWSSFSSNFKTAPFELQSFFVFCFLVTIFGFFIQPFLPVNIQGNIIPITGGNMAGPYCFNLIITGIFFINLKRGYRITNMHHDNIFMLLIRIGLGLIDLFTWKGGFEANPNLFRSPVRPIWTIVIPIIWIFVLLSPKIKKYLILKSVNPENVTGNLHINMD